MTDEPNELRATLAKLHQQLRSSPNVSPETRSLLQGVAEDIDALLGAVGAPPDLPASTVSRVARPHDSIVERLRSAEREFEATHPTLSGIVGSLIDALGRMGI